jgi:hypothetical protein
MSNDILRSLKKTEELYGTGRNSVQECEMSTAEEFREYAKECLLSADEAETDDQRQSFLDMARDWTLAALRVEGLMSPAQSEQPNTATPER